MNYKVKIIIDGVALYERTEDGNVDGVEYTKPSVSSVRLTNVVTQNTLPIGDIASDSLTFVLNNPYKPSYDNANVELWVSPLEDGTETVLDVMAGIEDSVGNDTAEDSIDIDNAVNETVEDEEAGEDMDASEIADVEATEETINENMYEQLEGEDDTIDSVTTDEAPEPEWNKLGSYFVYSQTNGEGNVKLVCYDNMAKLNGTFIPANESDTIQNYFDDLCTQIIDSTDIVVDTFTFPAITVTWDKRVTYRDALGYIAGLVGGYVDCDEDGELSIAFAGTDADVRLDTDVLAFNKSSAGEVTVSGITCNTAVGGEADNILNSGVGEDLSFNNPFMTQTELDNLLPLFDGFRLMGGTLAIPWDMGVRAGGAIRLMNEAEYSQYLMLQNALAEATTDEEKLELKTNINELGNVIFICSQTVAFEGKAVTSITSAAKSVSEEEAMLNAIFAKSLKAETTRAMNAETEAGKTATNYLHYDVQNGLYVTDDTDTLQNAVKIDSDSVDIIKDGEEVASFGETSVMKSDGSTLSLTGSELKLTDENDTAYFDVLFNSGGSVSEIFYTTTFTVAFNYTQINRLYVSIKNTSVGTSSTEAELVRDNVSGYMTWYGSGGVAAHAGSWVRNGNTFTLSFENGFELNKATVKGTALPGANTEITGSLSINNTRINSVGATDEMFVFGTVDSKTKTCSANAITGYDGIDFAKTGYIGIPLSANVREVGTGYGRVLVHNLDTNIAAQTCDCRVMNTGSQSTGIGVRIRVLYIKQ